jgi:hypothetical protein
MSKLSRRAEREEIKKLARKKTPAKTLAPAAA